MVVNHARPEIERRRALAHMTGHVLLALADSADSYPRADGDHQEADLVARDLMMPTSMVLEQARTWFNDYRYLSRLFGVDRGNDARAHARAGTRAQPERRGLGLLAGERSRGPRCCRCRLGVSARWYRLS